MAGIKIEGGSSTAGSPNVDADYNLQANLPYTTPAMVAQGGGQTKAGFVTGQFEIDKGFITGTRLVRSPGVSEDLRLSSGLDTTVATHNFTSTVQDTAKWKHAFTTMAMTKSGGFLNINPGLATVSGNYAYLQTWRHFTLQGDGSLQVEVTGQITGMPPSNQIFECGLFAGTAGIAPTDGAFFRLTSAGLVGIVVAAGSGESSTGVMAATVPSNTNGQYRLVISQRTVSFYIDGTLGGTISVPAGLALPYLTINLPLCFMMRNSGTVVGGCTVKIGEDNVTQKDLHTSKPWSEQMGTQGNAYQGQDGDTVGSIAAYSNAALSAAAALANATAAAPNTGLGGVVLVLPTLVAGTDGILFSYLNPVGGAGQPPKTLVVTGITLDATVQVALTGGPLALVMSAAFGHTAVSLATAETSSFVTATTKAPRRVPLCTLGFPVTAPAGTGVTRAYIQFKSPISVNPGEYFAITCRNVATVTSAGALVFTACVDHYFE